MVLDLQKSCRGCAEFVHIVYPQFSPFKMVHWHDAFLTANAVFISPMATIYTELR